MRSSFMALQWVSAWIWIALGATSALAATADPISEAAVVEQPRPFGHILGDVITQRVRLTAAGAPFTPADLPTAQRINVWFERRKPRIETTSDGTRWLAVDYQVINTPQTLATVTLPAWTIKSSTGATLTVPAWPISIAALTPVSSAAPGVIRELRPDRAAPTIDTGLVTQALVAWTAAFAFTLVAWFGWLQRRKYRDRLNKPFARAWQEIQTMDETAPEAWQALHRAFDRAAGRVVQPETLPLLFAQAPHLAALHSRIEQFFTQSSERFFGKAELAHPLSVRALCRELRQIEKRCVS